MRFQHLVFTFLAVLLQAQNAIAAAIASNSLGSASTLPVSTVTTSLTTTFTEGADVSTFTGTVEGKSYIAYLEVKDVHTDAGFLGFSSYNTYTFNWAFEFKEAPDAFAFHVYTSESFFLNAVFGPGLSNAEGQVNLEQGAFIYSYEAKFFSATFLTEYLDFTIGDYFAFDWEITADTHYVFYAGALVSAVEELITGLVCGVVGCKTYSEPLDFQFSDLFN
ncbi:hypothetical protein WICMUC_003722 [Wickerhamomyces mucosus]|uniref:Secreted protein n=1 Tax=Wickerhamomyces mucosus TaxID=1378264 RepID=A0A9P8TBC7_9ASCO|nr:hypothetical protein WICMUC_003722 [Wickerhamomyces mucosus]